MPRPRPSSTPIFQDTSQCIELMAVRQVLLHFLSAGRGAAGPAPDAVLAERRFRCVMAVREYN